MQILPNTIGVQDKNDSVTPNTHPAFQKLNKTAPATALNDIDIKSLEQVKFGFVISKGGMHSWMFSKGYVYEVHWDKVGSELYEATPLRIFLRISGVIVVPFEQAAHLTLS